MRWSASERHFATGKRYIFIISGVPGNWDIFYHDNRAERVGEQRFYASTDNLGGAQAMCEELDKT